MPAPTAIFCYAPADAAVAHRVGEYLELNLDLVCSYEEAVVGPACDLIDAVGRGLSAERTIVLLSPDSVPKRWDRERWEPVFTAQPQLYLVLVRECNFPPLLRRQKFCDLPADGLRHLKRLLIHANPVFPPAFALPPLAAGLPAPDPGLWLRFSDRPGIGIDIDRQQALAFAHAARGEFEGVCWIDCERRSHAGMLGDTGQALGLRLTGATEQNRELLRRCCRDRRCLFVYDNVAADDRELLSFGGRASVLFLTSGPVPARPVPARPSHAEIARRFAAWPSDPEGCLGWLRHAHAGIQEDPANSELGTALVALLKHFERLAEVNEILEILISAALLASNQDALHRLRWDQNWILGHWGEPYSAAATATDSATEIPSQAARATMQLGFVF